MDDKAIRRKLRDLAEQAYEEELRRALAPLAEAFERWQARATSSVEISDLIHEFHQGPARELRGTYQSLKPESVPGITISPSQVPFEWAPRFTMSLLCQEIALWVNTWNG